MAYFILIRIYGDMRIQSYEIRKFAIWNKWKSVIDYFSLSLIEHLDCLFPSKENQKNEKNMKNTSHLS